MFPKSAQKGSSIGKKMNWFFITLSGKWGVRPLYNKYYTFFYKGRHKEQNTEVMKLSLPTTFDPTTTNRGQKEGKDKMNIIQKGETFLTKYF